MRKSRYLRLSAACFVRSLTLGDNPQNELPHRRRRNDVFGFDCLQISLSIFVCDRPIAGCFVVRTARYPAAHLELAAQRLHLFRARLPHHAGTSPRIAKGIDERLDYVRAVSVVTLRNQRILDGAAERKSFDALRRPVGRDFLAAHAPNFFGVTLEECVEEPFAELIAYPFFEIARISHRKQARFHPRKNAKRRPEDAKLEQRFERFQRIGEKFAVVKNPRRTRSHEHVVRQNLGPQIFDRLGLGKETVPADVEVKTLVGHGPGNSADVNGIGFQDNDIDFLLRQKIAGR